MTEGIARLYIGIEENLVKAVFIDHYDSFSFNVIDLFEKCGVSDIEHVYSDQIDLEQIPDCDFLILSPGPKHPDDEIVTKKMIEMYHEKIPVFGICLGHQMICSVFGAAIEKIPEPHHGTTKTIYINSSSVLFEGLGEVLEVATYNSLGVKIAEKEKLPFNVIAVSGDDVIEAIERNEVGLPYIAATQFHPESFLSEQSETLIMNFLKKIRG